MTEQSSATKRHDVSRNNVSSQKGGQHATKTPLFAANNAYRYQRQTLIRQIQDRTKRSLICYVSGSNCMIDASDTAPFVDLLHNVVPNSNLDLLLHTNGGTVDAAEKIMLMIRSHVDMAFLRIIVPDCAKSAGTLMVLGADSVVMSDMSELGPIDPQLPLVDRRQSVQNYLDAYRKHAKTLETNPRNAAARIMLEKLDPVTLILCEAATDQARKAAESLLKRGMFRKGGNWSRTASELLDTARWRSHGRPILWEDARDPHIGLVVEHLAYHSDEWQDYWRLYCLQRLAVENHQKLFESDFASLVMGPAGAK